MSFADYKSYTKDQKDRLDRLKEMTVLIEQIVNDSNQLVERAHHLAETARAMIADID